MTEIQPYSVTYIYIYIYITVYPSHELMQSNSPKLMLMKVLQGPMLAAQVPAPPLAPQAAPPLAPLAPFGPAPLGPVPPAPRIAHTPVQDVSCHGIGISDCSLFVMSLLEVGSGGCTRLDKWKPRIVFTSTAKFPPTKVWKDRDTERCSCIFL